VQASLILGPLWALWHLPLFITGWGAVYQSSGVLLGILLFVLVVICYTIFMTWLFNHTRGSLFLAILAHSAIDSTVVFFLPLFSQIVQAVAAGAIANRSTLLTMTITRAVIAALVIGLTKGRLSYKRPMAQAH
jgi:uncharacterized protein